MIRTALKRSFLNVSRLARPCQQQSRSFLNLAQPVNSNLRGFNTAFRSRFMQMQSNSVRFSSTATIQAKTTKPIVAHWLYFNAGMVFAIVVVGGLTRLTESGLSITEWNVISGMKPPRSEAEWHEEFEKYKQFPEYKM